jgi:hypothetical protein
MADLDLLGINVRLVGDRTAIAASVDSHDPVASTRNPSAQTHLTLGLVASAETEPSGTA